MTLTGGDAEQTPAAAPEIDPSASTYPVARNLAYTVACVLIAEKDAIIYNNFNEFCSHKNIHRATQKLPIRPWENSIDGIVEKPIMIGFDELLMQIPLEERVNRHRCMAAWAMTAPWSGFPLKTLVDFARPLDWAKYLAIVTFQNAAVARGQNQA